VSGQVQHSRPPGNLEVLPVGDRLEFRQPRNAKASVPQEMRNEAARGAMAKQISSETHLRFLFLPICDQGRVARVRIEPAPTG
jgi:hypothetical protein